MNLLPSSPGDTGARPKLAVSFSGGRTSAYMLLMILDQLGETHDIQITFANTGCEHPATLDFVDQCDRHIAGGRVVWLEAVVDPTPGIGIRHRVVDYFTASRDGRPFRDYIAKYGIPNATNPACTTRLKSDVMESFLASMGWLRGAKLNYDTAIGIRADEIDRVSSLYEKERFVYPLISAGITKGMVLEFWRQQPFDLKIPGEHYGNCVFCWKKSFRKLLTVANESPEFFDFPAAMDREFGSHKAEMKAGQGRSDGRRVFFRKYMSTAELLQLSKQHFRPFTGEYQLSLFDTDYDHDLDVGSACGESCEIGADR